MTGMDYNVTTAVDLLPPVATRAGGMNTLYVEAKLALLRELNRQRIYEPYKLIPIDVTVLLFMADYESVTIVARVSCCGSKSPNFYRLVYRIDTSVYMEQVSAEAVIEKTGNNILLWGLV